MTIRSLSETKKCVGNIMKKKYTILGGRDYHEMRLGHPAVKHSLKSRTDAIVKGIKELYPEGVNKLLDIGGADGLMARGFECQISSIKNIYTLDLDIQLLKHNPFDSVLANSCEMPFENNSVDVITAAAIIEHMDNPKAFLQECFRVLRPTGGLFITCPSPFFDWLATKVGYLKDSGHIARYSLTDLKCLCDQAQFNVVFARKFMPSPISLPYGVVIESAMKATGLSFLFLNQIIGAVKLPREYGV